MNTVRASQNQIMNLKPACRSWWLCWHWSFETDKVWIAVFGGRIILPLQKIVHLQLYLQITANFVNFTFHVEAKLHSISFTSNVPRKILLAKYVECFDWSPVANQRIFYISQTHIGSMTSQVPSRCAQWFLQVVGSETARKFFLESNMVYCSAFNCNNDGKKNKALSFFQFPTNEKYRQIWKEKVRRLNWEPNKFSRLCSAHFEPHCFLHNYKLLDSLGLPRPKKATLKHDAIPTIFDYEDRTTKPASEKILSRKRKHEESNSQMPFKGRKMLEVAYLCRVSIELRWICVLFTLHNLSLFLFSDLNYTLWLVEVVLTCEFLIIPTFSYTSCLLLTPLSFGMIQLVTYRHKSFSQYRTHRAKQSWVSLVIRSLPPKHHDRVTNSQMLTTVFFKMLMIALRRTSEKCGQPLETCITKYYFLFLGYRF